MLWVVTTYLYFFIFIYITYSNTIIYQFLDGNEKLELFRISSLRKVMVRLRIFIQLWEI